MRTRTSTLALVVSVFCSAACDVTDPCDPGQIHTQGLCLPAPPDSGQPDAEDAAVAEDSGMLGADATSEDSAAQDAEAPEQMCTEDLVSNLYASCMEDADCSCAAPFCARMGSAPGNCTVYCTPEPDDCPDDYLCFDLSAFGVPGIPPFCTPDE